MFEYQHQLRVRYAETDKMGYAYYGNYAAYFEVARVESLRSVGIVYGNMEHEGVMLPVLEFNIKYFRPALYDELLTIKLCFKAIKGSRIYFDYETYNEKEELLNKASTTLVFASSETKKPIRPPQYFLDAFKEVPFE